MNPRLIILDADGTLIARDSGEFLPGVEEFLNGLRRDPNRPAVAVATNQGGVGCRVMGGFDHPERYPTEAEALRRYRALAEKVGAKLYLCFAYQSREGDWSPTPADAIAPEYWRRDWRKPAPGMLLRAMADAGVGPAETLMIGDRPEDESAADGAGVLFMWANEFFKR